MALTVQSKKVIMLSDIEYKIVVRALKVFSALAVKSEDSRRAQQIKLDLEGR